MKRADGWIGPKVNFKTGTHSNQRRLGVPVPHSRLTSQPGEVEHWAALRFMKIPKISTVMAATILLVGCGKQNTSSGTPPLPAKGQAGATAAAPVAPQAALSAWQQGDKPTAISNFLAADWTSRPLFASDSPLNLSESQFESLSDADRHAKSDEMMRQLNFLRQLAAAVAQAGRDAASKGDTTQARKCFATLKQCGTALNSPDCLKLVRLAGNGFNKMADTELAKIGK